MQEGESNSEDIQIMLQALPRRYFLILDVVDDSSRFNSTRLSTSIWDIIPAVRGASGLDSIEAIACLAA